KPQSEVIRASSAALRVAGAKRPSVNANPPGVVDRAWIDVPQASRPVARAPGAEALQAPVKDTSLTTIELGTAGVNVLVATSLRADNETKAFGVTTQQQQEISCSSGENPYTATLMLPPEAPLFVMLITPSGLVAGCKLANVFTAKGASVVTA